MTASMPKIVLEKLHDSRKNKTSKKAKSIITATACAMAASTAPNFLQHMLRIGPMRQDAAKNPSRIAALIPIGAKATIAILISEDVGLGSVASGLLSWPTPT